MPTESFAIEPAINALQRPFTVTSPAGLLNEVKDSLISAGWGFDAEGQELGLWEVSLPYGASITTVPDPAPALVDLYDRSEMVRFESFDPDEPASSTGLVRFCLFDPYRENPIPNAEIEWVAMGLTVSATLDNLAGAIAAETYFSIGAAGVYMKPPAFPDQTWWIIPLEADVGGTHSAPTNAGGNTDLDGSPSGYWSSVEYMGGAGWHLTSSHLSASLDLYLLVDTGYPAALFRAQINDALACDWGMFHSVAEDPSVEYRIVASVKQFFLWTEDFTRDNCMISLPFVFADRSVTRFGVFAFGLGWRNTLLWTIGWSRLAVNSGFLEVSSAPSADRQAGLCYSYNSGPFAYAEGNTLIENSFAMAPRADLSVSMSSRIIGKLWNAFVMRRDATPGERILFDKKQYMCVAREAGRSRPVGSLWIRIE